MIQLLARRNRLPLGILRYRGIRTVGLGASFGIVKPPGAGVSMAALEGFLVSVQMLVGKRPLAVVQSKMLSERKAGIGGKAKPIGSRVREAVAKRHDLPNRRQLLRRCPRGVGGSQYDKRRQEYDSLHHPTSHAA